MKFRSALVEFFKTSEVVENMAKRGSWVFNLASIVVGLGAECNEGLDYFAGNNCLKFFSLL
ncbi:MAG: hypothetical protein COW01_09715 [Bdellovibrionales bacterium CG12_big_fil_rev_8_21_14_0_65_38_15]|nr:MAG: hypothetical protein COW01_09715 [Bdellovibrionales bacterium CG12_big_fil_rev_8_21_14_0_65_38_15]